MTTPLSVLVTGVSTGIGRTTAATLLAKGHTVYGSARKAADFGALTDHASFTGLVFDVTDRQAIKQAIQTIQEAGPLHAVVNNAGVAITGPLETLAEEQYRLQFEVNVFGVLAVTQEALPLLHAAKEAGAPQVKVINISSISGYLSSPFTGIYSASKFALEAITDAWRRELHPYGIDVISIAPGPVKTPIWAKGSKQTAAYEGTRYAHVLDGLNNFTKKANAAGLEPQVIADRILRALVTDQPRPDQLIMKKALLARVIKWMPKRMQDRILLKNLAKRQRY